MCQRQMKTYKSTHSANRKKNQMSYSIHQVLENRASERTNEIILNTITTEQKANVVSTYMCMHIPFHTDQPNHHDC